MENNAQDKVIVYKQKNGNIGLVVPTQEGLDNFSLQELAEKDIPLGCPFKIVGKSDVPSLEDTYIETWEIDDADLNDGVGKQPLD
jgi:hypothetical protein